MRKKNTALIFVLFLLIAGMSTGCQKSREDYSEIEVKKGNIAAGLTKEGSISIKTAYETIDYQMKRSILRKRVWKKQCYKLKRCMLFQDLQ